MDYFDMITDTLDSMSMDAKDKFMDYLEFADINPTLMSIAEGLYAGFDKDMAAEQAGLKNRAVMMKYVPELREYLIDFCNTKVYLQIERPDNDDVKTYSQIVNRLAFGMQLSCDVNYTAVEKIFLEAKKLADSTDRILLSSYLEYMSIKIPLKKDSKELQDQLKQFLKSAKLAAGYVKLDTMTKSLNLDVMDGQISKEQQLRHVKKLLSDPIYKDVRIKKNKAFNIKLNKARYLELELSGDYTNMIRLCMDQCEEFSKSPFYYNSWVYQLAITYNGIKRFDLLEQTLSEKLNWKKLTPINEAVAKLLLCKSLMHQGKFEIAQNELDSIDVIIQEGTKLGPYIKQLRAEISYGVRDFSLAKQLILTMPAKITKSKEGYNLSNQLLLILCHYQLDNPKLAITSMRNLKRYCNRTLVNPERKELYRNIGQILPMIIYKKYSLEQILERKQPEIKAIQYYYETIWNPNQFTDVFRFHELLESGFFLKNSAASCSTEGQLA